MLIPRLPHHGLADRMTTDLDNLTAEELVAAGNQAVDLAQGLGEEVSVFGFSAGGALASWLAQTRSDLAQATVAAPLFGPGGFPPALVQPIANLFRLLPNQFVWWDDAVQDRPEPPLHAYPRYSRRGVGEALRLALLTKYQADAMAPATHDLRVITNGNENSVSNEATSEVVTAWRQRLQDPANQLREYVLPADWQLIHDFIDPTQKEQQVDKVYPVLLEQVTGK